MAVLERISQGWRTATIRLPGLTVSKAFLALGVVVLAAIIIFPDDNLIAGLAEQPSVSTGPGPSSRPPSSASDPTATRGADPTATQAPITPEPQPALTGGDAPAGPVAVAYYGSLPETVDASPQFLALRDRLADEIDAYKRDNGTDVAVAVSDLQNGSIVSVNGNRPQRTGCTINQFALYALVSQFQAGAANAGDYSGMVRIGIGSSYPPEVKHFLESAFGNHEAGVQRARELMASWGMSASLFDHVPYFGNGTQNNLLTALETNRALTKLYQGEMFNAEWTAYTLARLREIKPGLNYMIPGQLPAAATVAHKIGYYADSDGWVNADAGIVTFRGADGQTKAYVITYLSEKAPSESTGYSFGARLSRIAWDYFAATYGSGAPPPPPPPRPPPPPPPPSPTRPRATNTPRPPATRTPTPRPPSTSTATPSPTPTRTPTPFGP